MRHFISGSINLFMPALKWFPANVPILYPLEAFDLFVIFREYKMVALAKNGFLYDGNFGV